ncbi:hypothetical protein ACQ4PT_015109 [Festuca glaucescens]
MALEHVTWEPYGTAGNVGDTITFNLNPKCLNEAHLWHMRGPMICVYAVEWHLPHRARTQLNPPAFARDAILLEPNLGFDQMANMEYNKIIRNGRWTELAPIVRFAQNELSKHVIEAREALKYPPGEESYRALRAFAEVRSRKDRVIEEEEPLPHLGRRRRGAIAKRKDVGNAKRGKGKK